MSTRLIMSCPTCGGSGVVEHRRCSVCLGDGRRAPFGNQQLYWGASLSAIGATERQLERWTRTAMTIFCVTLGIGGIFALGYDIALHPTVDPFTLEYWSALNPRATIFLLSVWGWMYLWGRNVRMIARREQVLVLPKSLGEVRWQPHTQRIDMSRAFSTHAFAAIERAAALARRAKHTTCSPVHLMAGVLTSDDVGFFFARLGIARTTVAEKIKALLQKEATGTSTVISDDVHDIFATAYVIASTRHAPRVKTADLLLALARQPGPVQSLLFALGTDMQTIENVAAWAQALTVLRDQHSAHQRAAARRSHTTMNRSMTAIATPMLDSIADDLTLAAVAGNLPPLIGREKELNSLFRVLEGGKRSVLLVGDVGVGKEAFLYGIAQHMAAEDVPKPLQDMRFVMLSISRLVAGGTAADISGRLERVLYEVAVSRNIVLAIPNIEGIIGITTGASGGLDIATMLENGLSKYHILAIASTTPDAYRSLIEQTTIGTSFEKVDVPEPDRDAAIRVCELRALPIENEQRVFFSYSAVEKAVTLSDRYMHDRRLPEKAIVLLQEAAQSVRAKRGERATVTAEDIATILSEKTRVPVTAVTQNESEKLLRLEERMHGRVIGQDAAVSAVAKALRRARTQLRSEHRPIANFLFLGPTGVGKTELAKTVAEAYFGNETAMVRLDMSEYQEQSSLARLIGVPGSRQGGLLTDAIRTNPFTLLLLDEIEKAHPDILNVFLQVMDDGRLTDAAGRTVDFSNVILIATSNAASQYIQDAVRAQTSMEAMQEALLQKELRGTFRPEFLNRFDGVIVFRSLTQENVHSIARLMLVGVAKQLEQQGIAFEATDEAIAALGIAGFDPEFGARPLRRVIQERVQDALANALLSGKVTRRDRVIYQADGTLQIIKAV